MLSLPFRDGRHQYHEQLGVFLGLTAFSQDSYQFSDVTEFARDILPHSQVVWDGGTIRIINIPNTPNTPSSNIVVKRITIFIIPSYILFLVSSVMYFSHRSIYFNLYITLLLFLSTIFSFFPSLLLSSSSLLPSS